MLINRINLVLSAMVGLAILCSPVFSHADEVPWTTKYYQSFSQVFEFEYTDTEQVLVFENYDNHFYTKPSNTHYEYDAGQGGYARAKCEFSYKRIHVSAAALEYKDSFEINGYASGSFLGEYVGTDERLVFKYSTVTQSRPLNFVVVDQTTGDTLYDKMLTTGKGVVSVSVPVGHTISVMYQLEAMANSYHNVQPPWTVFGQEGLVVDQAKLEYSLRLGIEDPKNDDEFSK